MWNDLPIQSVPILRGMEPAKSTTMIEWYLERWQKVVDHFPYLAEAHHHVARLKLWAEGRPDRAVRAARRAVELDPWNLSYRELLAEALFQAGQRAEAINVIGQTRKLPQAERYRCQRLRACYGKSARPLLHD